MYKEDTDFDSEYKCASILLSIVHYLMYYASEVPYIKFLCWHASTLSMYTKGSHWHGTYWQVVTGIAAAFEDRASRRTKKTITKGDLQLGRGRWDG